MAKPDSPQHLMSARFAAVLVAVGLALALPLVKFLADELLGGPDGAFGGDDILYVAGVVGTGLTAVGFWRLALEYTFRKTDSRTKLDTHVPIVVTADDADVIQKVAEAYDKLVERFDERIGKLQERTEDVERRLAEAQELIESFRATILQFEDLVIRIKAAMPDLEAISALLDTVPAITAATRPAPVPAPHKAHTARGSRPAPQADVGTANE